MVVGTEVVFSVVVVVVVVVVVEASNKSYDT